MEAPSSLVTPACVKLCAHRTYRRTSSGDSREVKDVFERVLGMAEQVGGDTPFSQAHNGMNLGMDGTEGHRW